MKAEELNLNSEALEDFKTNFDMALALLVREIRLKGLPGGQISAKIKIKIEEVTDINGQICRMMALEPDISLKLGTQGKIECRKRNGLFVKLNENGVPVVGSCQVDIDELLDQEKE